MKKTALFTIVAICISAIASLAQCTIDASYTMQDSALCTKLFISASTGGTQLTHWSFDDGSTAIGDTVYHSFPYDGYFSIECIVYDTTDLACADTTTNLEFILCLFPPACSASFSAVDSMSTPCDLVYRLDVISPYAKVEWDFGDGNTVTYIPSQHGDTMLYDFGHSYNVYGYYNITCKRYESLNDPFCDSTSSQILIACNSQPCMVNASFTAFAGTDSCQKLFMVNNRQGVYSVVWMWGDGNVAHGDTLFHSYALAGNYLVKCIVSDSLGLCVDVKTQLIYAGVCTPPCYTDARFQVVDSVGSTCTKYLNIINPLANSTVTWTINNDTIVGDSITYAFAGTGNYNVLCVVVDSSMTCVDSVFVNLYINCDTICTANAQFASHETVGNTCDWQFSTFTNLSDSVYWNFGDGHVQAGNDRTITHTYNASGNYTITCTVFDATDTCYNTYTDSILVNCTPIICDAQFITVPQLNDSCSFDFTVSNGSYTGVKWYFGDGEMQIGGYDASHTYAVNGTMTVACIVSNLVNGCADTSYQTLVVNCLPPPCDAQFTAVVSSLDTCTYEFSVNTGIYTSVFWNFGDGDTLTTTGNATTHSYDTTAILTVTCIVSGPNGCSDTAHVLLTSVNCDTSIIIGVKQLLTNNVHIYPNPAKDVVYVKNANIGSKIAMYDILGAQVFTTTVKETTMINVADFAKGVYLLRVMDASHNMQVRKIIIE